MNGAGANSNARPSSNARARRERRGSRTAGRPKRSRAFATRTAAAGWSARSRPQPCRCWMSLACHGSTGTRIVAGDLTRKHLGCSGRGGADENQERRPVIRARSRPHDDHRAEKADPTAMARAVPTRSASIMGARAVTISGEVKLIATAGGQRHEAERIEHNKAGNAEQGGPADLQDYRTGTGPQERQPPPRREDSEHEEQMTGVTRPEQFQDGGSGPTWLSRRRWVAAGTERLRA